MEANALVGLTIIVILGVTAQWIAWRFRFPSILLMLLFGFIAGPITGLLNPDHILGEVLFPFVSIAVAIILFEGGLSLKLRELRPVRQVVIYLVSIGAVITWLLSAGAAYYLLQFNASLSLLIGAILVVSGPTVIIPLLIQVRPIGKVGSVIKWEGIVNDPVGATLAVLVFEAILAGGLPDAAPAVMVNLINTTLIGVAFGVLGAAIVVLLMRNYWVPDSLQNPFALMIVIGAFTASNAFAAESGLIAVTLMGIIMANQDYINVKPIVEFNENLRVLLIAALFIILTARLNLESLALINWNSIAFLAILLFIVRPLATFFSTIRSELGWNERIFLAWMAPRGIVAAAVASIFALELEHQGYQGAEEIASVIFFVIIGTVTVYGLTAVPVGRWLKVTQPDPQGAIIAGAHRWARQIALALQAEGFRTLLIDTNQNNIQQARLTGLQTLQANIASDYLLDEIDLVGIGRLLALTSNDEVNSLAALHFREAFERAGVYQLAPRVITGAAAVSRPLQGRLLFGRDVTFAELDNRFDNGASVESIKLTETFDYHAYQEFCGDKTIPLFLISPARQLTMFTLDVELSPQPGDTIISVVDPSLRDNMPFPEVEAEITDPEPLETLETDSTP